MRQHYHFESESTLERLRKFSLKALIAFAIISIAYSSICIIFIYTSNKLDSTTKEHFYKRSPDLIAVFTGDSGRIKFALEKSKEYKQPNVFITGVYSKNTVKTILKSLKIEEAELNTNHFVLDYLAQNTLENVLFTHRYLQKRKDLKSIMIVSHDYHIPRIRMIINKFQDENQDQHFHYTGIKTDYGNFRNIKLLYKEVFKMIRTYGLLVLWDPRAEMDVEVGL
ncbi:MAG: YdcF family protein [Bacteriovoracaceae bacterium]|nr:YdcF family protein [Bacteriovoracaceae bacterium]